MNTLCSLVLLSSMTTVSETVTISPEEQHTKIVEIPMDYEEELYNEYYYQFMEGFSFDGDEEKYIQSIIDACTADSVDPD